MHSGIIYKSREGLLQKKQSNLFMFSKFHDHVIQVFNLSKFVKNVTFILRVIYWKNIIKWHVWRDVLLDERVSDFVFM